MWRFTSHAVVARGVVIGYDRRHNPRADLYCPKVRFSTQSGKEVVFIDSVCSAKWDYQINAPVPILYDQAEPGHALIQKFSGTWYLPTYLSALGILGLLLSLKMRQVIRRRGGWFRSPSAIRA
jgi:hypothetical protein